MDINQLQQGVRLTCQAALKSGMDPRVVIAVLETQKLNIHSSMWDAIKQPLIERADATQLPKAQG